MRINHDEWRDIGQAVYVKCTHLGLSICVGVNYRISVKKMQKIYHLCSVMSPHLDGIGLFIITSRISFKRAIGSG
jgi:hypothetical protein